VPVLAEIQPSRQSSLWKLVISLLAIGLAAVFSNYWLRAAWYTPAWSDDVRSFGFTLMTAGVLSAVFELTARREVESFMERRLADIVRAINNAAVQITSSGLQQFKPERSYRDFEEMLAEAKSFFVAIGTSLPDVSSNPFVDLLKERLEADPKMTVKMLFLNPFSVAAALKNNIEVYRHPHTDLFAEIVQSVVRLRKLHKNLHEGARKRLEVRVYCTLPTVSCVFTDERLNISFYDENRAGNRTPAWVFVPHRNNFPGASLYNYYQKNFELVWNRPDSINALGSQFESEILSLYDREGDRVQKVVAEAINELKASLA
jgi:hypothetical protein